MSRDLTSRLYDALASYPALTSVSLRHAQIRQDLAEHLAQDLNAFAGEGLSASERTFLTFALGLAADVMASRGDEFTAEDEAALTSLRHLAASPAAVPVPDETAGDETGEVDVELKLRVTRSIHALKSPAPSGSEHYRSGWDDGLEAAIDAARDSLEGGDR